MHIQIISRRLFMGGFVLLAAVGPAWAQRATIADYGYEESYSPGPIGEFFGFLFFVVFLVGFIYAHLSRESIKEFLGALMGFLFAFGALGALAVFAQLNMWVFIIAVVILGIWSFWPIDPAKRADHTPSTPPTKAEKQAVKHTSIPERQQAIDTWRIEREKVEAEQAQRIEQERRRAEADKRALALYESNQKVEQQRQQEIQRKAQQEHEAHELRVREELSAQALARQQHVQREAEAKRQWEQAQRAERERVRYQDERNDDEPHHRLHPTQVTPPTHSAPEPIRPSPSVQSSDDGGMPTLRSDHWRIKGGTLICLASGENIEHGRYRVEDGFYVVSSSRHKGRIRVSEVAELIRHQK
jgi:flagellar biosynthesis GTPase FlhF